MRITIDKEVVELSISRKCDPRQWDRKAEKLKGKNEEARELNHHLANFRMKVFECRLQLIEQAKPVTVQTLKNLLTG